MSEKIAREFLDERQQAYRKCLTGPLAEILLADLSRFCRAEETCFHADPRIHAALEGRREVWLRIQDHLKLSLDELAVKYGATKRKPDNA